MAPCEILAFRHQIELELGPNKATVDAALEANQRTLACWNGRMPRAQDLKAACGKRAEPEYRGIPRDAVTNCREDTPILQSGGWESAVAPPVRSLLVW